ncbi:MAG: phospho-sugar mutase [Clostridiales bacterium]|jgi:phosphoglucomutase|nr:phospho-sugar mutase [Clostridiales bacterium]
MTFMENYQKWLSDPYFDEKTKEELKSLAGNEKEIEDRFYKNLEFGTGGLRGVLGAGSNRMNIYTVRQATQGLANYIIKHGGNEGIGIAVAHDSRRMSREFALETALVCCANGIPAYIFPSLRPTPMLSFAVRNLGCIAGVVITASHNPAEYNGYKAYWADGGQIPFPRDEEIIKEVALITSFSQVKTMSEDEAKEKGLLKIISHEVDDAFVENVKAQIVNPEIITRNEDLKIVYTPLHGAGNRPVRRVLSELGFKKVYVVPEQEFPDPNFTTVSYPNPEDFKVFELAIKLAAEIDADIIAATDPDCDRVGIVVRDSQGNYSVLTGNMTGALLCNYVLSQRHEKGIMPEKAAVVSTIVSTDITKEITKKFGVKYYEVLTGFKYIGEKIKEFENTGENFVFGFEESYGCLAGTYARDKDAVVATALICEMTAYYKEKGMTLYDALQEMYKEYGYYKESIQSITLKGKDGAEQIKKIMSNLRLNPPKCIGGAVVSEIRDYTTDTVKNIISGKTSDTGLPASNVLYYELSDGSWFCVRPSGTEPKIKVYFGTKGDSAANADEKLKSVIAGVMEEFNNANS